MRTTTVAPVALTEDELQRKSQCGLYMPTASDPVQAPAERTLRWALRERHVGKIPLVSDLREHFMYGWAQGWNKPKDLEYWEGAEKARAFGRRMYEFLLKYEVIHPFEPYTLDFDDGQVTGENAVVLWNKARGEVPMVLDAMLRRPRDTRTVNYKALAQWLAARQDVDSVELGMVHLPLTFGEAWTTRDLNDALARPWINAIVSEAAAQRVFPRVGTQCLTCTQSCKGVFDGPDGHNWD